MKLSTRNQSRRGIAMTEYLIILAIVAIGAILVVGLFGKQVKDVFYRNTSTLGGANAKGGNADTITSASQKGATPTEDMKSFDTSKNNQ